MYNEVNLIILFNKSKLVYCSSDKWNSIYLFILLDVIQNNRITVHLHNFQGSNMLLLVFT
jgi:hypothetical protein